MTEPAVAAAVEPFDTKLADDDLAEGRPEDRAAELSEDAAEATESTPDEPEQPDVTARRQDTPDRGVGPTAPDGPDPDSDPDTWPERGLGVGLLLALAFAWLAATLWGTHVWADENLLSVTIATIAEALPIVVSASVVGGAAAGLAARTWLVRSDRPLRRVLITLSGSFVIAAASATAVVLRYGTSSVMLTLAGTIAMACLLGGAAALLRPAAVVGGALAGTLSTFITGALLSNYQAPLKSLLGSGSTPASQLAAANRFLYLGAALSGLIAGLVAYFYLRRRGLGWPAYLTAGGAAGVVYLVGQGLTQLGGATLLRAASGLSEADRIVRSYLDSAGISNGLIIGFVGAFVAMIAFGRTIRPNRDEWDDEDVAADGDRPAS